MHQIKTLAACGVVLACASSASAFVSTAAYPTSIFSAYGSGGWTGFFPATTAYGAGGSGAGSSGTMIAGYTSVPVSPFIGLASQRVGIDELRSVSVPQVHTGTLEFTPLVACNYAISGHVAIGFHGGFASAGANGVMSLDVVGGPNLASYNTTLFGAPSTSGVLFSGASPVAGSATGTLAAGVTYRWTWTFNVSVVQGGDPNAYANLVAFDGASPHFIDITFSQIPAPSGLALLVAGGGVVCRRRRAVR